ncbi:endonuclease [Endozoicomonas sp. (ex Bugula neritina AB1)]|nr:endonuclease [Endozoicomonas sp. (ex Bugula neritina AB1)]
MALNPTELKVLTFVQTLLEDENEITPSLIQEKISIALTIKKEWAEGLDKDAVVGELIRRASTWVGDDAFLSNDEGHIPWLTHERKKDWRYWQRYREYQEKKLSWKIVEGLDKSTDQILGNLEDPEREGSWDRRGLVVGHVQSGKTGNYTGLICKAADAGYKIIIVLAGMHNNLRSQTQIRLDEGFLGYTTSVLEDEIHSIGVGEIDKDPSIRPNFATNRSEKGDFNAKAAKHLGISPEQRPWLFVVKKNKSVLERLLKWIENHVSNAQDRESGRKLVTHLPLLIIDDEADNASVDTGAQAYDEFGKPDLEHEPTAINRLTRRILHTFTRKAYVGYTATPFANIFIHNRSETEKEGPDLFPSAFIANLSASSNYIGPAKVFGLSTENGREGQLPLVKVVGDHCSEDEKSGWMPTKHKNGYVPSCDDKFGIPESLRESIDAYVLTCSIRRLRGQKDEHCSMLVHVTRFTSVQGIVKEQVASYVDWMKQRLVYRVDHVDAINNLRTLWERDYQPVTEEIHGSYPELVEANTVSWEQIEEDLADAISEIDVRAINGFAKEALDYVDSAGGLKVIAVGGDKLARGLTLEGLCVSYFLRASRMYDTLMQMGRWFGYRPGYLDLCRLYTTGDLVEWFEHIADASEELREEFDLMTASGATPLEYGLKVASHPVLMVTSRLKMRNSQSLYLSFSGESVETVSLLKDKDSLASNLAAFTKLAGQLGKPEPIPDRNRNGSMRSGNGVQWTKVSAEDITEFLSEYKTHPAAMKVNSRLLSDFIGNMAKENELTSWTVAVINGGQQKTFSINNEVNLKLVKRTPKSGSDDRYSIGRLLSPSDEALDLDDAAWAAAMEETLDVWRNDPGRSNSSKSKEPGQPSGPMIRKIRGFGTDSIQASPERGLLLIYLLDPKAVDDSFDDNTPIVSFGISFPRSHSGTKVKYEVNNVLWEQEYDQPY